MLDTLPQLTIALALAALFGAAALHKLRARQRWPAVVRQYRVLPEPLAAPVALLVPLIEVLAAAALLWPHTRAAGAVTVAALLLAYAWALAINLRRGRRSIDCGCFGSQRRQGIAPWMLGRNLVLAALALALLLPTNGRALSAAEPSLALAFVVTLGFLYPVLEIVLRRSPPSFDDNLRAGRARLGF
jgi:uncharacterized membrane protein